MTLSKGKMDELRKQFGGKCENCGSNEELQFAHILPTELCGKNSRGSSDRYYDIRNNPRSYRLLCRICHNKIGPSVYEMRKMKSENV